MGKITKKNIYLFFSILLIYICNYYFFSRSPEKEELDIMEHVNNIFTTKIEDMHVQIQYHMHIAQYKKRKMNFEINHRNQIKKRIQHLKLH